MQAHLQKSEIFIGTALIALLTVALVQAYSYTQSFDEQAKQHQANAIYINDLIQARINARAPQTSNFIQAYAQKLGKDTQQSSQATSYATTINLTSKHPYNISARAYLVADMHTGEIYAQKNIDTKRPIASITKLLTALTTSTLLPPDTMVPIIATRPITHSDYKQIKKGDSIKAVSAIYPLLMESNNAVAHALADYKDTENKSLITAMADQAQAIGMKHTTLADASGISPQNTSTARDLFKLARFIYTTAPFIFDVTRSETVTIPSASSTYTIRNHNHFSTDPLFIGGKTGYTYEAKQTMLSVFNIPIDGYERTIAIIILGSDKRKKDVQSLYRWFSNYASTVPKTHNTITMQDGVTYVTGSTEL